MKHHVLIIDDEVINLNVLCASLDGDYDIQVATSATQGLQLVQEQAPDLILLDIVMPGMDGYDMLHILKNTPETCNIPVIFITVRNDAASETYALASGAVDFIHKPINPPVVQARVRLHLELRQHVLQLNQALERLQFLAHYDSLTGLANRSLFDEHVKQALTLARRQSSKLALMFLDLDKFKPINDHYGHAAGDAVLKQAAQRMRACLRASDTVGRVGGDEFVLLVQDIEDPAAAHQLAEKVRQTLNQPFVLDDGQTVLMGATIGVGVYPEHGASPHELIHRADRAMYQAKENGRNQVQLFQPDKEAVF